MRTRFFLSHTHVVISVIVSQSEKHIIDCAHSTTESLMRKLLGRVMAPEDVIQVLETKVMDEDVAFLPPNDRDIGEKCRIAIAGLGDDQSPDTIAAIIQSCTDWIQKFVEKMIKTLPFKQMLLFSRLYPPTLSKTSVSDCESASYCSITVIVY